MTTPPLPPWQHRQPSGLVPHATPVADMLQLMLDGLTGAPGAAGAPEAPAPAAAAPARLGEVMLMPHQLEGVRQLQRALATHAGALLADDVGTGKTFTALAVARAYPAVRIVAPASLRHTWEDACRRADTQHALFVSYERLSAGHLPAAPHPPLLILDEAHHARNPATRRYRSLARLARGVHVLLLSATPVHNRRRDLVALLALFLGDGAAQLDDAALSGLVVRRSGAQAGTRLPELRRGVRHEVTPAPRVLDLLRALPPPVPPRDGVAATPLVALQLTRAWCSSDAALLAAIRRRLVTAAALEDALREGRHPARHDLALWTGGDDGSVQLAFPALCAPPLSTASHADALRAALEAHAAALRALRALVRGPDARDGRRFAALDHILASGDASPAVIFTHSAETAAAAYAALRGRHRTALLTGRGAWVSSGPVSRHEVLRSLAPAGTGMLTASPATRLDVLVATDVVSEGVDLQRAATIVHLDFPWTVARLEQRIGRVRRVESPHRAIAVHVIAPPAGAEELARTLQLLARKAAVSDGVVGPSSILADAPPWGEAPASVSPPSPGVARQQLIAQLRALHTVACGTTTRGTQPVAVRLGAPAAACWPVRSLASLVVVALVDMDGEPQLLAGDGATLSIDPAHVLAQVQQLLAHVQDARTNSRRQTTHPSHRRRAGPDQAPLRRIVGAVQRWCDEQRAARLLALPVAQRSLAHRRLLLALDALPARLPRSARTGAANRVARARALVLAQRGAGAEASLEALAARAPGPLDGFAAAERWLDDVIAALPDGRDWPGSAASGEKRPTQRGRRRDDADENDGSAGIRLVALLVAGPDPPP